ncbi:MAG: transcription antitermination factor NusB [Clostridiales bacterium]|nr:transcription antitermination factor NusB [Clostridiales bacterium]
MDRKVARAHAMKLIYEWEMGGDGGEETRVDLLEVNEGEKEADFMNQMFEGVVARVEEIDEKIKEFAHGWSIDRITRVDLAILRLGVYELLLGKVPMGIVINEAVDLANQYSTDKAGSFINGILGNIGRSLSK